MGAMGPICFLGFSVHFTNSFSEHLERRARAIDRHYRDAYQLLFAGVNSLHGAVDAALTGDDERTASILAAGTADLATSSDHLTAMGEELVRTRAELFEREELDPSDLLIAREPFFASLDYDRLYRELAAHGAALPQRVFWDDVASRVRDGGARAGLRLLDRHLRELQSDLRTFIGEVETIRRLPLARLAEALHDVSRATAAIVMGFTRLLITFTYLSILCEQASRLREKELAGFDDVAAAGCGPPLVASLRRAAQRRPASLLSRCDLISPRRSGAHHRHFRREFR
jgi:hypothetical protein